MLTVQKAMEQGVLEFDEAAELTNNGVTEINDENVGDIVTKVKNPQKIYNVLAQSTQPVQQSVQQSQRVIVKRDDNTNRIYEVDISIDEQVNSVTYSNFKIVQSRYKATKFYGVLMGRSSNNNKITIRFNITRGGRIHLPEFTIKTSGLYDKIMYLITTLTNEAKDNGLEEIPVEERGE